MEPLSEQSLSKQVIPPPPLGLLIAAARRGIKHAATLRLRRRRLSAQQFWLLVAIHEQPGLSLRELAERRLMDSPTASRMVDALVRRGLVRIESCPQDRRRRSILLSVRGTALARDIHPLALQMREVIQEGLSDAESGALRRLLLRVIANVERFENGGSARAARRTAARRKR